MLLPGYADVFVGAPIMSAEELTPAGEALRQVGKIVAVGEEKDGMRQCTGEITDERYVALLVAQLDQYRDVSIGGAPRVIHDRAEKDCIKPTSKRLYVPPHILEQRSRNKELN